MAAAELEKRIHETIPLAAAMQFHIEMLTTEAIEVSAPLPPNVNIHGTGFAGSIYSVAVLSGWALCTHILEAADAAAELVVARAEIKYRAPVTGALECKTTAPAAARETFVGDLAASGKGVMRLEVTVGERPSAILSATYCAIASKEH